MRSLGRCLTTAFTLSLIAATGASAKLPEWGTCTAAEHGRYTDSACTVKAPATGRAKSRVYEGGFEWAQITGSFSGKIREPSSTSVAFETQAGQRIECASASEEDSFSGLGPSGAQTPLLEADSCQSEGLPCGTFSIGPDDYISNMLEWFEKEGRGWAGRLGFIAGKGTPSPVVGVSYASYNKTTGEREPFFPTVECYGSTGTVLLGGDMKRPTKDGLNSVIGTLGPVNAMTEELTLTFDQSSPGVQTPSHFEGASRAQYMQAFLHNHWEPVAVRAAFKYSVPNLEIRATE